MKRGDPGSSMMSLAAERGLSISAAATSAKRASREVRTMSLMAAEYSLTMPRMAEQRSSPSSCNLMKPGDPGSPSYLASGRARESRQGTRLSAPLRRPRTVRVGSSNNVANGSRIVPNDAADSSARASSHGTRGISRLTSPSAPIFMPLIERIGKFE